MRQRECVIVALTSILMAGCHSAKNAGTGGSALRVNFAETAKSPDAKTFAADHEVLDPGTVSSAPSRPTR